MTGEERPATALHQKAMEILQRLVGFYGLPSWQNPVSPLDELISTILSQNTNDRNRDVAFTRLRKHLPTWEGVRDAALEDVIEAIRPAGLANQKGRRIQTVLGEITAERGRLDLSFLREQTKEEASTWLQHFKGIGPKTAAIVLLFSLGIPAMPVDTHIYRVTGRLGLRPSGMTVEQTHTWMEDLLPPETYGPAHLNLIRLGREICRARKPDCPVCPLNDLCDYFKARNLSQAL